MMLPATYLYRHDEAMAPRPFACDVDERDWLWEGLGADRLGGHHLGTADLRVITIPELEGRAVFSVFAWQGKLVLELGHGPEYLVYEPHTGRCVRKTTPGRNPITWFGTKTAQGKLVMCERAEGKAVILDAPDAEPRVVPCPYKGEFGGYFTDKKEATDWIDNFKRELSGDGEAIHKWYTRMMQIPLMANAFVAGSDAEARLIRGIGGFERFERLTPDQFRARFYPEG